MAYFDFYLLFFVDLLDRYQIFNQPAWWKLSLFLQYYFIFFLFFKIQDSVYLPFYPIYELINPLAFFLKIGKTYSGYQSHAPLNDFFPFQKLSFGGRQSNVSMKIVVFISSQFDRR